MKKCFICGREYDETNRKHAADVTLRGKKSSINSIAYKGRILALCNYCIKAGIVCVSLLNTSGFEIDEPLVYENGDVEDSISN